MKHPPRFTEILRMWGLKADADMMDSGMKAGRDAMTERALESFFGKPSVNSKGEQ